MRRSKTLKSQSRRLLENFLPVCIFSAVVFLSCSKRMETKPLERNTLDFIFDSQDSNGTYALQYLAGVYEFVPNGFNRVEGDMLATMTDDAIPSSQSSSAWRIVTGGYSPFYNPDDNWVNMYSGIRAATICYNNIGVVPFKHQPSRNYFKAEARLLRAFFYYQLVKRFGGVPLLGDEVKNMGDDMELPRNSLAECVNYIVSECDASAPLLRPDPVTGGDFGRVSQGAALALKAEVLLFAASPLNNPENNADAWKRAADAAKAVMDLQVFKLENNFKDVFLKVPNSEMILFKHTSPGTTIETANGPVGYPSAGGSGKTSPTQELVDAFGMKNGKPISDNTSGYDESNPYTDRDPRFYHSILYNGAKWLGSPIETFEGGKDKPGSAITQTLTGYYMRKFMGNFENESRYSNHARDFIHIRYAGILLTYAEALNEYSGPSQEVYDQLIAIRKRAGVAAGADALYGLAPDMTTEQMRKVIRDERRVELAFEEHRFWDIRRWKIAEDVYTQPLHGMKMSIYQGTGEISYQRVPVVTPVFVAPRMYRYPIAYNILITNDNLEQNPGWGR